MTPFGHPPIPAALRLSPALAPTPSPASWAQGSRPPILSPGKASPYQGLHTGRDSLICNLSSVSSNLLARSRRRSCYYYHLRQDTTRHRHDTTRHDTIPQGTTRSALDSHLVSLKFDTAWPLERLHLKRSRVAWSLTAKCWEFATRTLNLTNRRLLHSGQR